MIIYYNYSTYPKLTLKQKGCKVMIIKADNIAFENKNDIIDYVSKGFVPTRKNFENVMHKVHCPDNDNVKTPGNIYVHENLFMDCDKEELEEVLRRVYNNRVRNRNFMLTTIGLVTLGLFIKGRFDKDDEECDSSNCDNQL